MLLKLNVLRRFFFAAANLLLPEVLISHFDLIRHQVKGEDIHFYFTELYNIPEEFAKAKLHSKGSYPQATIQDFPILGKSIYLHITRRIVLTKVLLRWDWDLVAKGTRITSEFGAFLK